MRKQRVGTIAGLAFLSVALGGHATEGALLSNNFESATPFSGWTLYRGNGATIEIATGVGGNDGKFVKMTDSVTDSTSPSVWQPQLERTISTITTSFTVDFDWYLTDTVDNESKAIQFMLQNKPSSPTTTFTSLKIGGPSGILVGTNQVVTSSVAVGQWNHIKIIVEPSSTGYGGTWTVISTQGDQVNSLSGVYSDTLLMNPNTFIFQLGGGAIAGDGVTAYFDNIVVDAVPEVSSLCMLGAAAGMLLGRRSYRKM